MSIAGFELGQDALHVYARLLAVLSVLSIDSAWAVRCLRKWLASLNPAVRFGRARPDETLPAFERRGAQCHAADWPVAISTEVASFEIVLKKYFAGESFPANAFNLAVAACDSEWKHPQHGLPLPMSAKVVLLEDAARAGPYKIRGRQAAAQAAYGHAYKHVGHPNRETIVDDLRGLSNLFAEVNFERACDHGHPNWYKAQVKYLKHTRARPSGPLRETPDVSATSEGSCAKAAHDGSLMQETLACHLSASESESSDSASDDSELEELHGPGLGDAARVHGAPEAKVLHGDGDSTRRKGSSSC